MSYTREQIEQCAKDLRDESERGENSLFGSGDKAAAMLRQLLAENDSLKKQVQREPLTDARIIETRQKTSANGDFSPFSDTKAFARAIEAEVNSARASTPQAS